ncbi:MAG: hypothetical protein JWN98_1470 [Abditibacteriota bacterium]|nr:hypothetical protein [Abditibacteriota bacterium]
MQCALCISPVQFSGKNNYHVTRAGWQNGIAHVEVFFSPDVFQGGMLQGDPAIYYSYGSTAASVQLFYEVEGCGRLEDNVQLTSGTYHCL